MKTLQQINSTKSIAKRFSVMDLSIEMNYTKNKQENTRIFTLFFERKYKEKEEIFVSKKGYAIARQVINQRNRISTHYRKQILKKIDYGQ